MQGVHGIGKRKRAVIVRRSANGEYSHGGSARPARRRARGAATPSPVPVRIDIEPLSNGGATVPESSPTGVRQVTR